MGIRESTKDRFKWQRELVVDLKSTPGSSQTPWPLPQGASLSVHNPNHRHFQQTKTVKQVLLLRVYMDGLNSFFCSMSGQEARTKALKIAVRIPGVEAASLKKKGHYSDRLEIKGKGIDAAKLTRLIRRKVGHADLISVEEEKKEDELTVEKKIREDPSPDTSSTLPTSDTLPLDGYGSQNFCTQQEERLPGITLHDSRAVEDHNEITEEPSSYPSLVLQSSQSFENPLDGCGSQNFNAQSEEQFSTEDPVYEISLDDFFAGADQNEDRSEASRFSNPSMAGPSTHGKRVLKRPQKRHEWIKAESARLKLETAKSEMAMETNNSKYKAKMGIKVALAQMQLEFEKEKYQLMEKHYQIALAFSWGLFILFLALYVTRI